MNVLEAVSLHFEDAETRPRLAQLHYVKDADRLIRVVEELADQKVRQKGSHVRLRRQRPPAHSLTIPLHEALRVGTLHSILVETLVGML